MERVSALSVEETLSSKFQLTILRSIERNMPTSKRKIIPNWKIVQDFILGNTSHGGSTSCFHHCHFLGVDPDGFSFWEDKP